MKSLLSLTLALIVALTSAEGDDNELGFLALSGQKLVHIPNVEGVQSVTVAGGPNSGASAVLINALLAIGGAAILPSLLRSPVAERRSNLIEETNFISDDADVKTDRLGSWIRSRKFNNRGFKAKKSLKHKKKFNPRKGFSLKKVFGSQGIQQKKRNNRNNRRVVPKNAQNRSFRAPQLRRRAGGLRRGSNKPRRPSNSLFSLFKKNRSSKQNLRQRRKKFLRNPAKFFRPEANAAFSSNKRGPLRKLRKQLRKPLNALRNSKPFITKRPRVPQRLNTETTIEKPLNPLPSEHPQGQENRQPHQVPVYQQKDPEASLRDSRPADVYEPRPGYLPTLFRDKLAPSTTLKGRFEPFDNNKGFDNNNFHTKKGFDTKKSFNTNFDNNYDNGYSKNSATSKGFDTGYSTSKGFENAFSTTKDFENDYSASEGFENGFGPNFGTTKSFGISTEHPLEEATVSKSFHDEHDALWDQMRFPLADIKSDGFHESDFDNTNYVDSNNNYGDNEQTDRHAANEWTGTTIGFDGFDDFKKIPSV